LDGGDWSSYWGLTYDSVPNSQHELTTTTTAFACVTGMRLAVIDWPTATATTTTTLLDSSLTMSMLAEGAVSNKCVNTLNGD